MSDRESSQKSPPLKPRLDPAQIKDEESPFSDDALGVRVREAQNLTTIIQRMETPFVLAIDAKWGSGKTWFVRRWERELSKEGHTCIYFNAWESDFSKDPFAAFTAEIYEKLPLEKKKQEELKVKLNSVSRILGGSILNMLTAGVVDQETIQELRAIWAPIDDYQEAKTAIQSFKKDLGLTIEEAIAKGKFKQPLIFMVDELDRCRPDFAISLLERIKHLFNIHGITFVISLNLDQLYCSVQAVYGPGFDGAKYLQRFFDLTYSLLPATKGFVNHLFDHFSFPSSERVYRYPSPPEDMRTILSALASTIHITLRDLEDIALKYQVFRLLDTIPNLAPSFFVLAAIELDNPSILQKLLDEERLTEDEPTQDEGVLDYLTKLMDKASHPADYYICYTAHALAYELLSYSPENTSSQLSRLEHAADAGRNDRSLTRSLLRKWKFLEQIAPAS